MDHKIRRARNSGNPVKIVERVNTVAGIVFDSESHINDMEILGKANAPPSMRPGVDTLDCGLAILTAKDKTSGIHFELGDVHINLPD
jgi:hypothetical protein